MKPWSVLFVLLFGFDAVAKPPAPKAPHAAFPVGMGTPVEKLPDRMTEADLHELERLKLLDQVAALETVNAMLRAQLAQCQEPARQGNMRTRAAEAKQIQERYKLQASDIVCTGSESMAECDGKP